MLTWLNAPRVRYLTCLCFMFLTLMLILRGIFYWGFSDVGNTVQASSSDLSKVLYIGMKFDLRLAILITLPILLCAFLPRINFLQAKLTRSIVQAYVVIVVTDISVSSVRHCRRLIDFFTADNVTLPIKIVVNGEKKPMIQSSLHREASKALGRKLDYWLPHDPKAAKTAADRGKPLSVVAARSPLSKAVAQIVKQTKMTPNGSTNRGATGV